MEPSHRRAKFLRHRANGLLPRGALAGQGLAPAEQVALCGEVKHDVGHGGVLIDAMKLARVGKLLGIQPLHDSQVEPRLFGRLAVQRRECGGARLHPLVRHPLHGDLGHAALLNHKLDRTLVPSGLLNPVLVLVLPLRPRLGGHGLQDPVEGCAGVRAFHDDALVAQASARSLRRRAQATVPANHIARSWGGRSTSEGLLQAAHEALAASLRDGASHRCRGGCVASGG
mmetsp:Transcript_65007/g.188490  ORF Transcript_65007/g.188490 Transcript_65007/m.188490 type:complete len:228 (+) Transcript_65007:627-1310(+)